MYQILSEKPDFCRRYYKKHFGLYFSGHSVYLFFYILKRFDTPVSNGLNH